MRFEFFGTKRKKEKLFLVLDVGTEAVKGLICKKENSKVIVLGASTQYFERYRVFDGRDFEMDVIKRAVSKTIKEAGIGVAMGDSAKHIRDAADYVTKDFEKNGAAYAIEKFCL